MGTLAGFLRVRFRWRVQLANYVDTATVLPADGIAAGRVVSSGSRVTGFGAAMLGKKVKDGISITLQGQILVPDRGSV